MKLGDRVRVAKGAHVGRVGTVFVMGGSLQVPSDGVVVKIDGEDGTATKPGCGGKTVLIDFSYLEVILCN